MGQQNPNTKKLIQFRLEEKRGKAVAAPCYYKNIITGICKLFVRLNIFTLPKVRDMDKT